MNILKMLLLSVLLLVGLVPSSYAMTYNGWTTIKLENEIEFQIPPTLEVQSLDYKLKLVGTPFEHIAYSDGYDKFIAQQKGLNDSVPEAFRHYVRVFVYLRDIDEDMPAFGENPDFSYDDLREFEQLIVSNDPAALGIVSPAGIVNINGNYCINLKYLSQSVNNPPAIRDKYYFFNGRRSYEVSLMIRTTEYDLWTGGSNDVRNIVKTLKLVDGQTAVSL